MTKNIGVLVEVAAELWAKEFLLFLPLRLRSYFDDKRWIILDKEGDIQSVPLHGIRPIAVSLPAEQVLLRRIETPLVSCIQLPNLMKYEASRHVPLPLSQAELDFRVIRRDFDASRLIVELAVLRRETVENVRSQAATAGQVPDALALSTTTGIWFMRRPFRRSRQDIWLRRRHRRVFFNLAMPVLILLGFILAVQNWSERFATKQTAAAAIARDQATGIEPLRQQLDVLNDQISFLAQSRTRPSVLVAAEEVARLLPDDGWLQELVIEDQTIQLRGIAHRATDLLRIFSASPLFHGVQFEAPLTQAQGADQQQFDITMVRN